MFYTSFRTNKCFLFVTPNLKCFGLFRSTIISLCSQQKIFVTMTYLQRDTYLIKDTCICKEGATLITFQQHPGRVPFIVTLSLYRYIRYLLLHLLCNYGYTIVSILVCDIALKALLQGSYLLPFCLHLTFKTYIFVMDGIRDLLMLSLDFGDDVLQLCCLSTTLKVLFRPHFW